MQTREITIKKYQSAAGRLSRKCQNSAKSTRTGLIRLVPVSIKLQVKSGRSYARSIQPSPARDFTNVPQRSERMKQAAADKEMAFPPSRVQRQRRTISYGRSHG